MKNIRIFYRIYTGVLLVSTLFFAQTGYTQISLSQTTVNNYVSTICGTGITFSNATLTGDSRAIANFTGGISGGLGSTMDNGVVMSTGMVNTAAALTGTTTKDGDNSGGAIPQLTTIAGASTYDGLILEFDFIPITNQINVNFQFGSEEYNWYVNSSFNDAFAFYISGPGITGSQNIAVVPSTTTPVTINSINNGYAAGFLGLSNACSSGPCTNCTYYKDNCSNTYNNAMNGFTTVLTASQAVTPCQTYHIKLMIADGGDELSDSWVFVQENGLFAAGNPPLSLVATYPIGNALYEDCSNVNTITFTIPTPQGTDYSFNVTWGGTATSGVDYGALPTSITIPAGQTSISIPVNVFPDGIVEGVETIECTYPISICSNGTAIINIDDSQPLTVDAGPDTDMCGGAGPVTLTANPANANGTVAYSWDNGAGNTQSVSVTPGTTTTYTVTATDQCGRTATDQVSVAVGPAPVIDAGANTAICSGGSSTLQATGGVSYTWDNGLGAGNGVSVSPIATTTYTVTGTDVNGCSATDQVTITVTTSPAVDAGSPQSICQGASATLTGTGAQNYTWDNGLGAGNGVSVSPTATTTYTVTGTDANGCSATDQVTITVNNAPNVNAGPDQSVCLGGPLTLTATGAQTYSWDNGIGLGSSVIINPLITTVYTVTGTDANGCSATDQVTVTVNLLPGIDAGSNQTICEGNTAQLIGTGAQSYSWDNGLGSGNNLSVTPLVTTIYTVTGTDANGCTGTDQVTVTVNPNPTVDAGSPQTVCQGVTVTLSGSGTQTYTWDNGVTNGTAFTPANTQTYTVTGTDANGCTGTDQVTVTVNPLPNVDAGQSQAICSGSSVTLNGSGAQSYSWDNGITNGVPFTPSSTLTYTVTGTDVNGCSAIDQVTVTVNSNPVINAGLDQTICNGYSVTLSGSGGITYTWDNGVTNGTAFTPASTQTYTVTGTDANGCTGTDQVNVTVLPAPVAGLGASGAVTGYPGLEVTFINSSQNANTYDFDYDNGNGYSTTSLTDTPSEVFGAPGTYIVVLTASNGYCSDTAQLAILINPYAPLTVIVPNIFTPNGDHDNDEFFVRLENATELHLVIVNRWGDFMAEINEVYGVWDGTIHGDPASEGVYFYKYEAKGQDGTIQTGHGDIELIR